MKVIFLIIACFSTVAAPVVFFENDGIRLSNTTHELAPGSGQRVFAFSAKWTATGSQAALNFSFGKLFTITRPVSGIQFFEVDFNYTNGLALRVDGIPVSTEPLGNLFPPFDARFVWSSTGDVTIDNLALAAHGNLERVVLSSFFSNQRNSNFGPRLAYDNEHETEYAVFNTRSGFVGGNAPGSRSLGFYALTSGVDAPDPHDWTIEGGPNSSGPWTPLATGDFNFTKRNETRVWPITNNVAFPTFRFSFPTNNSTINEAYVGEVRLFELKPVEPPHIVEAEQPSANQFRLTIANATVAQYAEAVTGPWIDLATNDVPIWTFTRTNAPVAGFYRASK